MNSATAMLEVSVGSAPAYATDILASLVATSEHLGEARPLSAAMLPPAIIR